MPLDCQLKLFDQLVQPIMLYSCEVWGFENIICLERLHLKFCKYILKVKTSTPDSMVYGELGRYPLSICIKIRMVSFWCKILECPDKLSYKMYLLMYYLHINNPVYKFKFIDSIVNILLETGYHYVWLSQNFSNKISLLNSIKRVLTDQFYQNWNASLNESSKALYYKLFKEKPSMDLYILELPINLRIWTTRFKIANHRLPIETGRWRNLDKDKRICTLCNNSIGDEYHFLLVCPSLSNIRCKYLPNYYCKNPSIDKFISLMKSNYKPLILNIAKFIKEGLCKF